MDESPVSSTSTARSGTANAAAYAHPVTLEHTAAEADKEDRQNQRLLEGTKALEESNREILQQVAALEQRILQLESSIIQRLDERGR